MILIIKHIKIEGPGTLGEFFKQTEWKVKTLELEDNEEFPHIDECEAIVSLGGPMNVDETNKYPFLRKEVDFIKSALKKEVPILGICLGAQLLAKACGARVKKAEQKEIGWYSVSLTDDGRKDSLFQGLTDRLDVFQWHEDTFEIPAGGQLLAGSDSCPHQAFRFGKNAYGLQFHIEVTPEIIDSWINQHKEEESQEFDAKDMLIQAYRKRQPVRKQADMIYFNFAKVIAASYNVSMT